MRKLYQRLSLTSLLWVMCVSLVLAQGRTVSGNVTDEVGSTMPGVNVLIKGTGTGTSTDADGKFTISIPGDDAVLVFTFVGYASAEVAVGVRTVLDIQLTPDVQTLSELVVTGYTEQRKRDITGAVSVVSTDELNAIRAPSFAQKLAGRAPGVTTSTSGTPGDGTNIRIRGISSFNGSDPLVIIDGIQIQGDKGLNGINPNDIESIQVLKDASAASIYGARANAGVIIVTTKQGKAGGVKVTYDGYAGVQTPVGKYSDFMIKDPKDYARIHVALNPNMKYYYGMEDGGEPVIPEYFFPVGSITVVEDGVNVTYPAPAQNVNESAYSYPDNLIMKSNQQGTDWWEEVFSPALITEHYIGVSGGAENATFNASVGYLRQDGTMDYTGFERFSARLNSRFKFNKFTFGESMSVSRYENVLPQGGNQNEQNTMSQIILMNSIIPVYDIAGNYAGGKAGGFTNGKNPVAFTTYNQDDIDVDYRILTNLFGEYELLPYLKFRTSFSVDYRNNYQPRANFPRFEDREVNSSNSYSEQWQNTFNWTWTNTLEFNKSFGDNHRLHALAGYEAVRTQFKQINGQVNNLAFMDLPVRYLNITYSTFNSIGSRERIVALASVFGKLDYEFKDKYLASFTLRRDGSSDFLPDERFGVFPAASIGWRISAESFMQNASFIDDLKLRAGWGITGNQNIPIAYNAYNQYGGRNAYDASYDITGSNTAMRSGYTLFRYGNPNTRWEENESVNVGLDAAFLNGKITMVLDVYQRDITGLIFNPPFSGAAGNSTPSYRNVASMSNKGFDLGLGYRGNITSELGFNATLNLSQYRNKITNLDGEQEFVFPPGIDKRFGEVNVWQVGYPISSFYGFQNEGMFQTQAEVDAIDQAGAAIGRFKRKDINKDGIINGDDNTIIGNPHPDLTLGLTLGLDYKNFDFSVFLFASIGNDIFNYNKVFTHLGQFSSNMSKEVLTNTWTPENPNAPIPKLDGGDTFKSQSSSFYVEDGSYLRAQNVTLGYTLPSTTNFLGFDRLRVYLQAQNLFTITDYSGIDPALSNVNGGVNVDGQLQNDGWSGYDLGNYPASKSFIFGVNVTF